MPAVQGYPADATANPPTFESVWAMLQETNRTLDRVSKKQEEIAEAQKETDRQMKENAEAQKETDRQLKETNRQMKETERIVSETSKQVGKLGNRFGEFVEYMVVPNLLEKFGDLGFIFHQANPHAVFSDENRKPIFEVDVFLQNGDKAMLVEVKTTLTTEDVKDHIERLGKMRAYADLHGDKRAFLGSVAGVVITDYVKEYALKQGLYVIEPSGETFNIIPPDGKPKEW